MSTNSHGHDLQLEDQEDFAVVYPENANVHDDPSMLDDAPDGAEIMSRQSSRIDRILHHMGIRKRSGRHIAIFFIIFILVITLVSCVPRFRSKRRRVHGDFSVKSHITAKLNSMYKSHHLVFPTFEAGASPTPQERAIDYLALQPGIVPWNHTKFVQQYVLAVFYYSTHAVKTEYASKPYPWANDEFWLDDLDASCKWYGVYCDDEGHVEQIRLPNNNLSGDLPIELKFLSSSLHTLDLSNNFIVMDGPMYDIFTDMSQMHTLLLEGNFLSYGQGLPSQFQNMKKLKELRLSRNLFKGHLDRHHEVLSSLTKLTHLEIESNHFSGSLPSILGKMSNLVFLALGGNAFSGDLNLFKSGELKNLATIWLDDNAFNGTIPTEIGLSTKLSVISITNSTLRGHIPTEIGKLIDLEQLRLNDNMLFGNIPTQMSLLKSLSMVELHHNNLGGTMPVAVCETIKESTSVHRMLTSDCKSKVNCSHPECCTACY